MSTITGGAPPQFGARRAYRIALLMLSFALAAVTALAVFLAVDRAGPTALPSSTTTGQVVPRSAGLNIPADPECAHARVLC